MKYSKAQIVATIGPSSFKSDVLKKMIEHQMDVVRLNLSWGTLEEKDGIIRIIRRLSAELKKVIPIILDLPGPRIQEDKGHCLDENAICAITEDDKKFIKFAIEQKVDYVAVSFVSGPEDIDLCRDIINFHSGKQKIIAKIERKEAIDKLEEIIKKSDALMVARGDLGNEIPFEQVPFIQDKIINTAKNNGKPVIVATEMLLSMVNNPRPTRAEVTDVTNAILKGADAVMLSEETTKGNYPVETIAVMEKIILEAEKHLTEKAIFNHL